MMKQFSYVWLVVILLLSSCGEPEDAPSICECMQMSKQLAIQIGDANGMDELNKLNTQKALLDKKCAISLKAFEGTAAERAKASEELMNCVL